MAQLLDLLNRVDESIVLVCRVIAQHVHIESNAFLGECKANSSSADDRNSFSGNLIAEERQVWMPESPFVLPREVFGSPHSARKCAHHEKCKLRSRFRQHIGCVSEWNLEAVRIRAVDIVEPDCDLGYDLQRFLARLKYLRINRIPQRGNQPINA